MPVAYLLSLLACVAAPAACAPSAERFRGDGTLETSRQKPRARIRLKPLDLARPAVHEYRFSGVPGDTYYFGLVLSDKPALHRLRANVPVVRAMLTDDRGDVLGDAAGPLVGAGAGSVWSRSESYLDYGFWHKDIARVRLRSGREYRLKIEVQTPDDAGAELLVVPTLKTDTRSL